MLDDNQRKLLDQLAQQFAATGMCRASKLSTNSTNQTADNPSKSANTEKLLPGTFKHTDVGKYFHLRRSIRDVWSQSDDAIRQYRHCVGGSGLRQIDRRQFPELVKLTELPLEKTIYLDIETCGLAGSMTFLVGLMWYQDNDFVVDQLLAYDYAQEPAMLTQTAATLEPFELLVTFNGKRFDMPMLHDRAVFHKLPLAEPETHLDLLDSARRRWRKLLPNCQLQTLELLLCHRRRANDIPGHLIPQAYHDFVRDGNPYRMRLILHHNLLDLLTMAQVIALLAGNEEPDF